MKRILLILILLFPIVALMIYVFLGMTGARHATQLPVAQTNSIPPPSSK